MHEQLPSFLYLFANLSICVLFVWYLFRLYSDSSIKHHFLPALSFKIVGGLSVGLLYAFHYNYQGDTFSLYQDARYISIHLSSTPLDFIQFLFDEGNEKFIDTYHMISSKNPRALIMSKFIALSQSLTQNYWLSSIHFSLFSFWGIWALATRIVKLFPKHQLSTALAFFYFPSFVFWSSGILKESVLIGCLFLLASWYLDFKYLAPHNRLKGVKIISALVLLYIIFRMKYYYLAVFIPVLSLDFLLGWLSNMNNISRWHKVFIISISVFLLLFIASQIHPNLHPEVIVKAIVHNNLKMVSETSNTQALLHFYDLEPSLLSLGKNLPIAIWEGLFRPYFWESNTIFWILTGMENSVIMILAVVSIWRFYQGKIKLGSKWRILVGVSILYIISLLVLLSFASPNLGNLVRYKTGFSSIMLLLLFNASAAPHRIWAYIRT